MGIYYFRGRCIRSLQRRWGTYATAAWLRNNGVPLNVALASLAIRGRHV